MLKANQASLLQETNQQLIAIRQKEINYFMDCFNTYSIQCIVINGVQLNTVQQVLPEELTGTARWLKSLFWVSNAMTVACSCHCLFTVALIMVYGPGLALRGPMGSMTRAVKGMRIEHRNIFNMYCATITWFGLAALATVWMVMPYIESYFCTVIFLLAFYYWYQYSMRIYNRFKWKDYGEESEQWEQTDTRSRLSDDFQTEQKPLSLNPSALAQNHSGSEDGHDTVAAPPMSETMSAAQAQSTLPPVTGAEKTKGGKWKKRLTGVAKRIAQPYSGSESEQSDTSKSSHVIKRLDPGTSTVLKEGYLIAFDNTATFSPSRRYYMVLSVNASLWYYASKQTYIDHPKSPVKNRPIKLEDWVATISSAAPPYAISLKHSTLKDSKPFEFRCDTADELADWLKAFHSFKSNEE